MIITKMIKENSVRSNLIDVVKQPAEPPKPKIQLSLKYNLTNMTLSVVVHKIRDPTAEMSFYKINYQQQLLHTLSLRAVELRWCRHILHRQ